MNPIRPPAQVDQELYLQYPSLSRAETAANTRPGRRQMLALLPKGGVGAELGVFAGEFSRVILEVVQPRVLHLVDPWWNVFGSNYPNWGGYTDFGKLETRVAHDVAVARCEAARGENTVSVHVDTSIGWLETLPDHYLDWAYLDTTHKYDNTLAELNLLARKVKPTGLIAGDDYWTNAGGAHYGVLRAVHTFIRTQPYVLIRADQNQQYVLRRET